MSSICIDIDCGVPTAALLSTGKLAKDTRPALVSKLRLPIERLAIVVEPVIASTVKRLEPSAPTEKSPELLTVRSEVVVALVDEEIAKSVFITSPLLAEIESRA